MARDPASIGPMHWADCGSGRSGCRTLIIDWTTDTSGKITVGLRSPDAVRLVGGKPYIIYDRGFPAAPGKDPDYLYSIELIQPLDGLPLLAFGYEFASSWNCLDVGPDIGEAGIILHGIMRYHPHLFLVAQSPWSSPTDFTTPLFLSDSAFASGSTQRFVVSDSKAFVETISPSSIDVVDPSIGSVAVPSPRPLAQLLIPVHGGAFSQDAASPYGILFMSEDASWSDVIHTSPPRVPSWFAADRSDGDALVFFESDKDTFANLELWTMPYATNDKDAAPRKIASIDDKTGWGGRDSMANAGCALLVVDTGVAWLVRLSDGEHWVVRSEPGTVFARALWIDDEEVWLSTAQGSTLDVVANETGIVRIRRDTLGAPVP
jgi:hypothetical protein